MAYRNRADAGAALATALAASDVVGRDEHPLVLGVARGGVPVAAEVAAALGGDLDVVIARKIGAPGNPEFAIGAVAADGIPLVDRRLVRRLGIPPTWVAEESARQQEEVQQRLHRYRAGRESSPIEGRLAIVVDDGVATGSTLIAVLRWARRQGPARLVCAVPVGPPDTIARLREEADEVVCPEQPVHFMAVGTWYEDFTQTSDEEVLQLLSQ